jgi:ribonuclease D
MAPDTIRRLAWSPPSDPTLDVVSTFLRDHGAREWQIGLTAEILTDAMTAEAPVKPLD